MSGLLWRFKVHKIRFIIISILLSSCNMPIDSSVEENLYIDSYQINFDQNSNDLYIVLEIENYETADSITVELTKNDSIFYTFSLNDDGLNGDILPQDGSFSILENISNFEYGEYMINCKIIESNGNILNNSFVHSIYKNNLPSIIDVEMEELFYLDPLSWTNLNISVMTSDLDGLSDIDYVRYMINTDYLTKDDINTEECDHYNITEDQYNGYISDASWIMEYNSTINDSIYQFITSIPMRPSIECGGYGVVLFKFIVIDDNGDSSEINDITLEIISCGDNVCSDDYDENCESCNIDCGNCND